MSVDRTRLPVSGPAAAPRLPEVRRTRLSNGLAVWTAGHHSVPVVTVVLVVPAGAAQDPADRPGLASLTGDMLDEGSGARSAIDMHDALARIGAQFDTEVGADATLVAITTLSRHLAAGLDLLADVVLRPSLAAGDFERVRRLRLNRLQQLRDLAPFVAERAFARWIYGTHPYGHVPVGDETALAALTLDEVRGFHARMFVPEGATVIAVGDAPHASLVAAVEAAFGGWRAPAGVHGPSDLPEPPADPPAGRLALVHRPAAAQSELRIGQVAAARDTPDYHALLVLNTILGGQFISRINMNLRQTHGYTYGARTAFDFRRRRGPFQFESSVQSSVTADALREALGELEAIRGPRPATADEIETARTALTRGYARNFETAQQVARALSQLALYGLPDDYFQQFVPRVEAVGEAEVLRVARDYLHPDRMGILIVGDRDVVAPGLAPLQAGPLTLLPGGGAAAS
ncbi:MAG: insulinase family protein [Acidobacteriota bacterium]|nr:insulinase family protein [Acidobacteriota bacterium]